MIEESDVLDELIAERTARNPEFPKLMEVAARKRALRKGLDKHLESQDRRGSRRRQFMGG